MLRISAKWCLLQQSGVCGPLSHTSFHGWLLFYNANRSVRCSHSTYQVKEIVCGLLVGLRVHG